MAARASAAAETAAKPNERTLVLTRVFDSPPALMFKAWTEPEHLVRWWGPEGFTMPSCQIDLRPGGAYRYQMRSAEGTDHWLRGVFKEIDPPHRLVLTWAWENVEGDMGSVGHETLLTVTFADYQGKTKLTMHQAEFESVSARDAHNKGWSSALERLGAYVATEASK
jgi:uncharacterized protein YndB with AHSA1/START domain